MDKDERNETMLIFHKYICTGCGHEWELPPAFGHQDICPACSREKVRRIDAGIRQVFGPLDHQRNNMYRG
jgi:rRNA maturation endonuclease Nob1